VPFLSIAESQCTPILADMAGRSKLSNPVANLAALLEIQAERRILHLAAACAGEQGLYLLGEVLHLIFDLLAVEAALFEPCVEGEVFVAAAFLDSHDLCGYFGGRAE